MIEINSDLVNQNALLCLAWIGEWPPHHSRLLFEPTPAAGPWPAVPPPKWVKPLEVTQDDARSMAARSHVLQTRFLTEEYDALRPLMVEFLALAFPDFSADRTEDEIGAFLDRLYARATAKGFGDPETFLYWPPLAVIGGEDFDDLPYVAMMMEIRYQSTSSRLERLLLGVNVTLRNPWLSVLCNSVVETTTYSDGTVIEEDALGCRRIDE